MKVKNKEIIILCIDLLKSFVILYIFAVVIPNYIKVYGEKFLRIKISSSNSILVYNNNNNINIINKIVSDAYIIFKLFFLI